ncbi:zinc ribbon domain-containing protein [uncultured Selenomonas sp.]|uniref:zinc ribbon domain-containing protein n=1 Tax=uncultured Selenomonas sp. TaxID=159275 RepID=UPI0028D37B30|nr:zinc ribbon domain-containing protein [uncultured Selenomonas sp.]
MICKECGAKIEGLTRICPHCGERALIDDELETWSFIADRAAERRRAMPAEIVLHAPAEIPAGRAAQIDGLQRMKEYFVRHSNLYQVVQDLACIEGGIRRPSFSLWLLVGGLAAALIYVPLSPFLPQFVWTYYFILWGAVTSAGYLRAGRRYEHRRAEYAALRRGAENDLRVMYNGCADCFLPIEWTSPPRIIEMIEALQSGRAASVRAYMERETG